MLTFKIPAFTYERMHVKKNPKINFIYSDNKKSLLRFQDRLQNLCSYLQQNTIYFITLFFSVQITHFT